MVPTLTSDDEGKAVIAGNGDRIGTVADVRGEEVWVDPDAEVLHDLREHANWDVTDRNDEVEIQPEAIAEVTDEEVRLFEEVSEA